MRIAALLLLLAAPLLELALLIKLAGMIGFWPTMLLIVVTAVAGVMVARAQGMGVMRRMMEGSATGRPPVVPVVEGALLFVAGGLLISPGPIGDALGLALLVPPLRALLASRIAQRMALAGGIFTYEVRGEQWDEDGGGPPRRHRGEPSVIEGEFRRIDEDGEKPSRRSDDGKAE